MALQRRLDYGFNGFHVPFLPRGPRSARGKRPASEKASKNQMCAFELLASVAGRLLVEENSPSIIDKGGEINVKEEQQDEAKTSDVITGREISQPSGLNSSCRFPTIMKQIQCEEAASTVTAEAKSSESSVENPISPKRPLELGSTVDKDDDDKSSDCTQPCESLSKPRGPTRFWKLIRSEPKNEDFCKGEELSPVFSSRKTVYSRQSIQKGGFKRRKLFHRAIEGISEGKGSASSLTGPKTEDEPGANQAAVKLRINAFTVPELLIDLPETSTVGSLKKTVVDAVTAILCGGFRVGIQLQGKKLRDDSKTLTQAGIFQGGSLSFILEPQPSLTPNTEATPSLLLQGHDSADPPSPRCVEEGMYSGESDHDSAPSPEPVSCRALAMVREEEMQGLALVPYRRRGGRRGEAAPRRIRRPFSVAEVEALVAAVEKLGTGRWRDVKLCAFEDARHRTYVDLKDKWKTLVHTAKISPQQRRGEPVPQELLDRVLTANAFWSLHHAKRPLPPDPTPLLP
ncbi:telomere repeat-binding protein 6-like isoform X2 [Wolffia australiana]